jgi:uncharacterized membrane-anchored protein YhcB (DUF1043 family)
MVGLIIVGVFTGVLVVLVNEAYRRNLKKEIESVKGEIIKARLDLKRDYLWLIKEMVKVHKMNKDVMEALKREVPRINEEE